MDPLDISYFLSDHYNYTDYPPAASETFQTRCYHQLDELQRLLHLTHRKKIINLAQYRLFIGRRPCLQLTPDLIAQSYQHATVARQLATSILLIFQGTMPLDYPEWVTIYPEFLNPEPQLAHWGTTPASLPNYTTNPVSRSVSEQIPNIEITVTKSIRRVLGPKPRLIRQAMI
jgi:hypothetical protein